MTPLKYLREIVGTIVSRQQVLYGHWTVPASIFSFANIQMYFHNSFPEIISVSEQNLFKGCKKLKSSVISVTYYFGMLGKYTEVFFILVMSLWQVSNNSFASPQLLFIEQ